MQAGPYKPFVSLGDDVLPVAKTQYSSNSCALDFILREEHAVLSDAANSSNNETDSLPPFRQRNRVLPLQKYPVHIASSELQNCFVSVTSCFVFLTPLR